jgi:hypothetical protein
MTGGIGFSRQGQDSFKQNRALLNKRPMLKDSLHATSNQVQGKKTLASYEQILKWRKIKDSNDRRVKLLIVAFLLGVISISLFVLL